MRYLRSFARFWWDLIVGDDWRVAAESAKTPLILIGEETHSVI